MHAKKQDFHGVILYMAIYTHISSFYDDIMHITAICRISGYHI